MKKLNSLAQSVETEPHLRKAQKTLAEEMTKLIHGEEALEKAIRITGALFSGDIKLLSAAEILEGFKDVPSYEKSQEGEISLIDLLVEAKISSSKRQAREDVGNGAIYINGERITDLQHVINDKDKIEGQFSIIRRGKKKYYRIKYV